MKFDIFIQVFITINLLFTDTLLPARKPIMIVDFWEIEIHKMIAKYLTDS